MDHDGGFLPRAPWNPYPVTSPVSPSRRPVAVIGLLLACLLVFGPGLSGGFLFDDFPNIVTNPRIQMQSVDWDSIWRAAQAYAPGLYGRPLATIGFAFDFAMGGKDPWGYKVHSLLVHLVNALLVLALVKRLLALAAPRTPWPAWAALAITLLWAIHPIQVSSVLYIVQRMETLAATFVLLGLLAYLRGRLAQREGRPGWHWIIGSGALAGIGMLSKETAALFPLYTLALELTLLGFASGHERTARQLKWAYGVGLAAGLLAFALVVMPAYLAPGAYASRDFTLEERLLTQLRVLPMYLGQILLPLPSQLLFYYDNYRISHGWLDPATTLAGGIFLAALLGLAWRLRRTDPLFALGVGWFFAAHFLSSNVIRLELVFEHRNYFALLGVLLALAALVRRIPVRAGSSAGALAIGCVVLGFGLLTTIRSATWGDPLLLASDLVAKNPGSPRASSDLATLWAAMSDSQPNSPFFRIAMLEFERGSQLPGASPLPEQGLILMAATTGQPVDPAWWDRIEHKLRTRPISPQETMAVMGLAQQRYEGIELDDARLSALFEILLERRPNNIRLRVNYAHFLLTKRGDKDQAVDQFARAIAAADRTGDSAYGERIVASLISDGYTDVASVILGRLSQAEAANTPAD